MCTLSIIKELLHNAPYQQYASLAAIVSPQHVRKGSHSRRPTNEGLMALSGRKTERTAAVANPSPLSRVQSKPKLGP